MFYLCAECHGRAAGLAVLRQIGSKENVRKLWASARDRDAMFGVACPVCQRPMADVELPLRSSSSALPLDVCARCQFVWFDAREFEQFPIGPRTAPEPVSAEARQALALQELARAARREEEADHSLPSDPWKLVPAWLGMPIEERAPAVRCWPWVTYGLAALLMVIYAATAGNLPHITQEYGLVPAEMFRHHGITFITSFFLHAGFGHVVGNVYFLLIFGDNVEDDLGWWRCLLLIAVADFVGNLWHIMGDPHSPIPCVGASGGISAIITYYALRFPHARLGYFWAYRLRGRYLRFPAYVALIFWLVLQFLLTVQQQLGVTNVAALAHLGGAAVGLVAWLLGRIGSPETQEAV